VGAADTAVVAVAMVEAALVVEVSTEVAWAVVVSMAAFAEAVHVSRAEALEADAATAEVTVAMAMLEAMVMVGMAAATPPIQTAITPTEAPRKSCMKKASQSGAFFMCANSEGCRECRGKEYRNTHFH
jgi:hypothetical protein